MSKVARPWRVYADTDSGQHHFGSFASKGKAIEQAKNIAKTFGWFAEVYHGSIASEIIDPRQKGEATTHDPE